MTDQQTIVLTGASDGIGAAAARQLAEHGHRVVVVGRSPEKTAAVAEEIGAPFHVADFADLAQVRALAEELTAYPRIDVLANNAGGIFTRETTVDGVEKTFQVNHLAPFLLTHLLMDRLVEADAKVIQTSSIGHRAFGRIDLDDLDNSRAWNANKAYGDAKLANVLFTKELHRRYADQGVSAAAFHPGGIATNFANDTSSVMRFAYHTPIRHLMTSVETGGRRLVWLAEGTPGVTWRSGEYYERNKPGKVNPQVHDEDLARGLWKRSEAMLGL
ncbi:SDR family NAD(P)-dependent oxidoreductase [Ornithinimicrobium flavum]|uniref:SDR family NAD(P)-dependent oxidoreductase n=1 Tax=Ornithinimicrobium flavum TaxID=1288636 RepID=UPI00106F48DA|nr:SDR family NAD(P)-dependent oxidoreductase [Ornithinimicrobium flavum]